jgi:hypothetical protein
MPKEKQVSEDRIARYPILGLLPRDQLNAQVDVRLIHRLAQKNITSIAQLAQLPDEKIATFFPYTDIYSRRKNWPTKGYLRLLEFRERAVQHILELSTQVS